MGPESTVLGRLNDLLDAAKDEMLTYTRIKSRLSREFGANVTRRYRGDISTALIREMTKRRGNHNAMYTKIHRRNAVNELNKVMGAFAEESYEQLRTYLVLTDPTDFEGVDVVAMVRIVELMTTELSSLYSKSKTITSLPLFKMVPKHLNLSFGAG